MQIFAEPKEFYKHPPRRGIYVFTVGLQVLIKRVIPISGLYIKYAINLRIELM